MIVAARASKLTLIAHAIDGELGALCKARPRGGRWVPSTRMPVNCARCLLALSRPRFAFCEYPSPAPDTTRLHVRQLGMQGLKLAGGCDTRALCGALVSWDIREEVTRASVRDELVCVTCAGAVFPHPLASHAVRR